MDRQAALYRLVTRWRGAAEGTPQPDEGVARTRPGQLRQEHLAHLRRRGIPTWSEQPERCDACGRELLVGERASLFERDEELLLACPLCAARVQDEGALPIPASSGRDGFEQLKIAS